MKKQCKYCGKYFITKIYNQKFCNHFCRDNYKIDKLKPVKAMQFWLFARDEFRCIYCGRSSIEDGIKLVVEHIFPRWDGGQNTFYNLVTSCERCNKEKFGYKLPKKIILRIWDRNKKLGVKSPYKYTNEIIKEFEDIYPTTQIDLNRYFNIIRLKMG